MSIVNEALVSMIRGRLLQDSRIAAMTIDVSSADGFVCLIGVVDTLEQKTLAVQLVTGMIGVRSVRDDIAIRVCVPAATPETEGDSRLSM